MALGLFTDMLGGAGYVLVGDIAGYAAVAADWAGRHKVLTTDTNGAIVGGAEAAIITNLRPGDALNVYLSGLLVPPGTITTALLPVTTDAGVSLVTVSGVIGASGSAGLYSVAFHLADSQTALLTINLSYRYSIALSDADGNLWTPVSQAEIYPHI